MNPIMKHLNTAGLFLVFLSMIFYGCERTNREGYWNEKYDFIYDLPPIVFHYDHGILAGGYPDNKETVEIQFNDVCQYMGHVCLCGAGGYKIAEKAVNALKGRDEPPERGGFILISSRDHAVSDVIAYVLGCSRRNDPGENQYFIDTSIKAPAREYHYYIGYIPNTKAIHIIYRKHLLIGNELMDSLWKVGLSYENDPSSVSQADMELYRNTMYDMVKDVSMDRKKDLIEVELMDYDDFQAMLKRSKAK